MSSNTQNENLVTEIAEQTAKRRAPLDLREFQTKLLAMQRKYRFGGQVRELRKHEANRRRIRVRQSTVGECSILDTRHDFSKQTLYFELSNGQAVRADRAAPRPWVQGRRALPLQNLALQKRIVAEVEKNAARIESNV